MEKREPAHLADMTEATIRLFDAFAVLSDIWDGYCFGLFGSDYPRDNRTVHVVRLVMRNLRSDRISRVSDYQKELNFLGGAKAIRSAIDNAVGKGLVTINEDAKDRRAAVLLPTRRTAEWYNSTLLGYATESITRLSAALIDAKKM